MIAALFTEEGETRGTVPPPGAPQNPLLANLSKREIPSLYGLRGCAALAVVFYHYADRTRFMLSIPGPYAVTLFFELSGLLITWLLLKEIDATGTVDKGQFYLRRALRLFPVFYVVWGLCRFAGPFAGSWATFFYLGDYYHAFHQHYNILTVAWSLGVEEKFYLVWPLLLATIERSKLTKILFGVLLLEPIYRSLLVSLGHAPYTWFAFDCHLDPLVVGCIIAISARRGWSPPPWLRHPGTPVLALVLLFALQSQGDIVTYLLAVILISVIARPPAVLNNAVARYLGLISYSLYLCHGYSRDILWPRIAGASLVDHPTLSFVAQLAMAIVVSWILHCVVERSFLWLKGRFHKRAPGAVS